jgi:hypothetical protein
MSKVCKTKTDDGFWILDSTPEHHVCLDCDHARVHGFPQRSCSLHPGRHLWFHEELSEDCQWTADASKEFQHHPGQTMADACPDFKWDTRYDGGVLGHDLQYRHIYYAAEIAAEEAERAARPPFYDKPHRQTPGTNHHVRFRRFREEFMRLQLAKNIAQAAHDDHMEDHSCTRFLCECGEESDFWPRCGECNRALEMFQSDRALGQWWMCTKGHPQTGRALKDDEGKIIGWSGPGCREKTTTVIPGHKHHFINNDGCDEAKRLAALAKIPYDAFNEFWNSIGNVPNRDWVIHTYEFRKAVRVQKSSTFVESPSINA